jgi:DNA polymerase III subunit delta'
MDWSMIGHEWAVDLLAEHVAKGRERHAYLITGPQGVGRKTLALRFAQSLNCPNPPTPGQPCLKCSTCKRLGAMQHPDLFVVQAENEGEILRIDQVRVLQHSLSLAPYEARYRVALLLRFEEANTNTANAMLKTLEEPPPQVVVILTAKSIESLLPTIVSRCEVLRLRPLSIDETSTGLQKLKRVPVEEADKLAHIAGGRPGYALRLFEQARLFEQRQSWLEELLRLLASSRTERFAFARESVDNPDDLRSELLVWLTFWRDVLISSAGLTSALTNLDYSPKIIQLAEEVGLQNALFFVNAIESTLERIDRNVNPRLALEVLLMDYPRVDLVS